LALNINISDETAESFESKENYLLGVQYHPEAAPGPHDAQFYFDDFCQMMKDFNRTKKETQMVSEIHV